MRLGWRKISMQTLGKKILKIDIRKETLFLGMSRFWCKKSAEWYLYPIHFSKCKVAVWELPTGSQACGHGETNFRELRWIVFTYIFVKFWTIKNWMHGSILLVCQWNLHLQKDGFEFRFWMMNSNLYLLPEVNLNSEINWIRLLFWDFSGYRYCDKKHKTTHFS